jgi:hypothetical protein
LTATDLTVSIGATVTKDLNVGAAATVGAALTVTGDAYFNSDININKSLDVGEDLNVGAAATVGAALTVTGASKFAEFSRFEKDIAVGGATTVGGALTVTGNAYFNGNVDINGDLTYDEVNSRNINISGIATLGFATAGNAFVSGMTTTHLLNVGFGATMVKVQGTPATRVGINSIGPAFTLDVDGDSNVTGTVRQGGTALTELVSGDATALAIALG